MADKPNWDAIKAEYIAGGISYRDLSAKYGVSTGQITTRSKQEGWIKARKRCQDRTVTKTIDIVSAQKARSLANIMLASDRLADRIATNTQMIDNARDASDLAKALKYTIDTIQQVYGIQTPAQIHKQKMDEERLKLERQRLEMDIKRQEHDSNPPPVRIVIEQPAGEELDG